MSWLARVAVASILLAAELIGGDTLTLLGPGAEAPPFSLLDLDGKREALRVWCGDTLLKPYLNSVRHTVVISFWATYCKPCEKELPLLAGFLKRHQGEPVKLFCISIDREGAEKVRAFMNDKNYSVPILLDPFAKTAERYGVKSLPALFVVAPNGRIQYASTGFDEKTDLVGKLDKILEDIRLERSSGDRAETTGGRVTVSTAGPGLRERWKAVARIECGESAADIARELGVTEAEIRQWYEDVRRVVQELWSAEKKAR